MKDGAFNLCAFISSCENDVSYRLLALDSSPMCVLYYMNVYVFVIHLSFYLFSLACRYKSSYIECGYYQGSVELYARVRVSQLLSRSPPRLFFDYM